MAGIEMRFHLDEGRSAFKAGDKVKGSLEVRADKAVESRKLVVELLWETRGDGTRASGGKQLRELHRGEFAAGATRTFPFEFDLPRGPFTCSGRHLKVTWLLRATLDVPRAIDPKAEEEITVEPDPLSPPDWPALFQDPVAVPPWVPGPSGGAPRPTPSPGAPEREPGAISRFLGYGCLALLLAAVGSFLVPLVSVFRIARDLIAGRTPPPELIPGAVMSLLLLVVILVVVAFGLRNKVAARRLGKVVFAVEPRCLRRGEKVRVGILFTPPAAMDLGRATVRLVGEEHVSRGSGKSRKSYRHVVHSEEVEVSPRRHLPGRLPVQLQADMAVPAEAPWTFAADDNALEWNVEAKLAVPGWPDWKKKEPIAVHP